MKEIEMIPGEWEFPRKTEHRLLSIEARDTIDGMYIDILVRWTSGRYQSIRLQRQAHVSEVVSRLHHFIRMVDYDISKVEENEN